MKTMPLAVNVTVRDLDLGRQTTSTFLQDSKVAMLSESDHHGLSKLPAIPQPTSSYLVRPAGPVSAKVPPSAKPDYVVKLSKATTLASTGRRNLVDIYEESFDSDRSPSPTPSRDKKGRDRVNGAVTRDTLCPPKANTKPLATRRDTDIHNGVINDSDSGAIIKSKQAQVHRFAPSVKPEQHRPYLKAHSHRELSLQRRDNQPPVVCVNGKARPSRSRSSSSVLPILPSIQGCGHKSSSHPHIPHIPHIPTTLTAPRAPRVLPDAKKQRLRYLWHRAGTRLGLSHDDSEDGISWTVGPGDLARPVYSRWEERRHALAEPERMCMPQEVRERLEQDVELRKRSVMRKVSQFFTARLGLHVEEDLLA